MGFKMSQSNWKLKNAALLLHFWHSTVLQYKEHTSAGLLLLITVN